MPICEKCKRDMSRLFPVYDSNSGGYIKLCQKDAMQFIKKQDEKSNLGDKE